MRHSSSRYGLLVLPLPLALALLAACGSLGGRSNPATSARPPGTAVDRETSVAVLLAGTIQTMQRLAQSAPAEQAEIMNSAQQAFERAPRSAAQLRYGLLLAVPGPASRDPEQARTLLRELAAQPELLQPAERALLLVELAHLDRELSLGAENQRLLADALKAERDRQTVANRRLTTEIEENAKLRKKLDEAQAKLDAIAQIERNLADRATQVEGRKP
jgi:hypothetical protein